MTLDAVKVYCTECSWSGSDDEMVLDTEKGCWVCPNCGSQQIERDIK